MFICPHCKKRIETASKPKQRKAANAWVNEMLILLLRYGALTVELGMASTGLSQEAIRSRFRRLENWHLARSFDSELGRVWTLTPRGAARVKGKAPKNIEAPRNLYTKLGTAYYFSFVEKGRLLLPDEFEKLLKTIQDSKFELDLDVKGLHRQRMYLRKDEKSRGISQVLTEVGDVERRMDLYARRLAEKSERLIKKSEAWSKFILEEKAFSFTVLTAYERPDLQEHLTDLKCHVPVHVYHIPALQLARGEVTYG